MATANTYPTIDIAAGLAALEEDIPRVLRLENATSLAELGWTRPNNLTLFVPMMGSRNGVTDEYLLRLGFQAYRKWPPSTQFVNPETLTYCSPEDQHHVPKLTSPECHTHIDYKNPKGTTIQLICSSATLEFYEVLHSVKPEHIWRDTDTFFTTITVIRKAFTSFYQGRNQRHGH